jgi:hypothetical protein
MCMQNYIFFAPASKKRAGDSYLFYPFPDPDFESENAALCQKNVKSPLNYVSFRTIISRENQREGYSI